MKLEQIIQKILYRIRMKICWCKNYIIGNGLNYSSEEAYSILETYNKNVNTSSYLADTRNWGGQYDLSIIVPTYNNEQYIVRCLESIRIQETRFKIQVIVINDGSTDHTGDLLRPYEEFDNWLVVNQKNKGFSGARNTGIGLAQGNYLMFVDSDDRLCPNAVEKLMSVAMKMDADVVAGNYRVVTDSGKTVQEILKYSDSKVTPLGNLHGQPWAKVYQSQLFSNLCFPENYWFEDSIFAQIVWPLSKNVFTISDIVYEYTKNPFGITSACQGRPKTVDSLYITEALLRDRELFGLHLDQENFQYFTRMVRLTYIRTGLCDVRVSKSIFCVWCELIKRFESLPTINDDIEQALKNKNYRAYLKAVR